MMKKYIRNFLVLCLCMVMVLHTLPVAAASNNSMARGTYMSSASVYAVLEGEDDIIGNALVICLSKVKEINVTMYLQRAYGSVWRNASAPFYMSAKDTNELDQAAIIRNVVPGTYRIYIEVEVTGYDGLFDSVEVGTGSLTINT